MRTSHLESERKLRLELQRVQAQFAELEATTAALRKGDVDAIVVEGPNGSQVFTLQSPENSYRILAERMNEGAATLSADGTILFCNPRLAEMVKRPSEQLLGSSFSSILGADRDNRLQELLLSAVKNDIRTEGELLRKDAAALPVLLSVSQVSLGELEKVFCLVATDLSELKKAENARAEAMEELHELNQELESRVASRTLELADSIKDLESFAYSVSHDLRAPLRHIDGFLTLLSTKTYATLDVSAKHYVDRAIFASRRMGELIDDLLKFSRTGRAELHKTIVDLNGLVQEVLRELEPAIVERQIVWQLPQLPKVAADKAMLRQVIENLIGNALKFTQGRETAKIEVGFKPGSNGEVIFFVADNGAGFDMRYCDKLFQVFQRLHGEQEFEGTGIGLAIARSVVERHGGRVWAEGLVGEGATFYFSFPAECGEGGTNEFVEAHLAG